MWLLDRRWCQQAHHGASVTAAEAATSTDCLCSCQHVLALTEGDILHGFGGKPHSQLPRRHLVQQRHQHRLDVERVAQDNERLRQIGAPLRWRQGIPHIQSQGCIDC